MRPNGSPTGLRVENWLTALFLGASLALSTAAESEDAPGAHLRLAITSAENSLRQGEREAAEKRYREALFEGWLLMGQLDGAAGPSPEARAALKNASEQAVASAERLEALASAELRAGSADHAVERLEKLVASAPGDVKRERLLARALAASGQAARAVQVLDAASARIGTDAELAFRMAMDYLRLSRVDEAERLFARVVEARPIPQTHVLIGRVYRDAGQYERARAALHEALKQDPGVRRAHYYLGRILLADPMIGPDRLDRAIAEFQAELKHAPLDPLTNDQLGLALLEAERAVEALPALEKAARGDPRPLYLGHLGRCQLALDRPAEAASSLKRALERTREQPVADAELRMIHYQLGLALRKSGEMDQASAHLAEAGRLGGLATPGDPAEPDSSLDPALESSPLAETTPKQRQALREQATSALVRSYLNLGIIQVQQQRFEAAAELLEKAAELDADFPQVQSALGIAYFNARRYEKATAPLSRALEKNPEDASLRRTLAMAWLNSQSYAKAAALLESDPQRKSDASLQFAYGLALVRSERAAEAQAVFAELLARHGDSPELSVLLGQAHAQQGDFDNASAALYRALKLKPDVADAYATLGVIYLKQGRLPDAESALQNAIAQSPDDSKSRHNLAIVLDQQGRSQDALLQLRTLLERQPDVADARYLLGKILLAQGDTPQALEQLRTAARLAPEDANIHYQLAQAYQKSGHPDLAQQHFDTFRKLKDQKREAAP